MKASLFSAAAGLLLAAGVARPQSLPSSPVPLAGGEPAPSAAPASPQPPPTFPPPAQVAPPPPFPSGGMEDPDLFWVSGDYLLWWVKRPPLPGTLVTTGSAADANPGAVGQPGTDRLLGGSQKFREFSGFRLTAGMWFDADRDLGMEFSGFLLPQERRSFRAGSDSTGLPVIAFRYLDPPVGGISAEDAFQAAIPGVFAGGVAVLASSEFWGTEADLVANLTPCDRTCGLRLQALAGFRYLDLEEDLRLEFMRQAIGNTPVMFLGVPFGSPASVLTVDSFHTHNQFYGGQVGARAEYALGRILLAAQGKLALGATHEVVDIGGSSALLVNGSFPVVVPGGQFAVASNSGRFSRDEFAVVPEMELKIGYQFGPHLKAFVGYDFLYWSRVVRPGRQIDLTVDTAQVVIDPGFNPASPQGVYPRPLFRSSDFWAQGLTFGLQLDF